MLATLAIAPLMLAQAATAHMVEQEYETREVAYEELVDGDARAAVVRLEAELQDNPGDPAILINLASAHSLLGNYDAAQSYYRAARDADEGYQLELANGRWADSREVATLGLASVEFEALAAR